MNKIILFLTCLSMSFAVFADNDVEDTSPKSSEQFERRLQDKYELDDDQAEKLNESGLPNSQKIMAAELSKRSGEDIEDILEMRNDEEMGWGQIAKNLNVHPSALGNSVSSFKAAERNSERAEERIERKSEKAEARAERRAKKMEKRMERRAQRMEKRAEKAEKRAKERGPKNK